ncbi:MAG: rhomboid family intramembrane serine protease [Armatimonadota bacterium]
MPLPFPIVPLPIRTDRTLRQVPYVTYTLIFINLFVYLTTLRMSEYQIDAFNHQWGFITNAPGFVTLFTHAFLHGGFLHLAGNLFILWLMGTVLEAGIGSPIFALLYLTSQIMSILLFGIIGQVFTPDSLGIPLVGASGAIAGVTGFAAFRYYRVRVFNILLCNWIPYIQIFPVYAMWLPLWAYAVYFGCNELYEGIASIVTQSNDSVAHWAHIGGLGLGMLAAVLLKSVAEGKREFVLEDVAKATSGTVVKNLSMKDLEQMLKERPDDPELLEAVAALWMVNGGTGTETGRDIYLRAIPLFHAVGQFDRAAISYLNVIRAFPNTVLDSRVMMALGGTLETMGHHQEAARAFALVAEHFPDRDDAHVALLRTANIYWKRLNDGTTAVKFLQYLLKKYPSSPSTSVAKARLSEINRFFPQAGA